MPSSQAWRTSGSVSCPGGSAASSGAALDGVLGVGPAQVGRRVEVLPVADRHEHVLQLPVGAQGVVGVVGHDRGQAGLVGQPRQLRDQPVVVGQQMVLQLHVEAVRGGDRLQPRQRPCRTLAVAGQQPPGQLAVAAAGEDDEAVAMLLRAARA